MKINFNLNPSGIAPVIDPEKLADNMATTAENVTFDDGRITPVKGNLLVQSVASGTKEIYKHKYEIFYNTCGTAGSSTTATGAFAISIDDEDFEVTGINYTGANSTTATNIQTQLRVATGRFETCVFDTDHFVITAYGYISQLSSPSSGTDISEASYINGTNGTLIQGEDYFEWLTYDEKKDIVPSPLTNDQYTRVYMTDSDGQLKISGLFGERDLKMPTPVGVSSLETGKLKDFADSTLTWYNGTKTVDCGKPSSFILLEGGYAEFIFTFPEKQFVESTSFWDSPVLQLNIDASNSIPSSPITSTSNIVTADAVDLTYGGRTWGSFDVVSATGTYGDYLLKPLRDPSVLVADMPAGTNTIRIATPPAYEVGDKVLIDGELITLTTPTTVYDGYIEFSSTGASEDHEIGAVVKNATTYHHYQKSDIVVTVNLHSDFTRERNSYYLIQYIDDIGQESEVSEVSDLITSMADEYITITLPTVSPLPSNIVYRRIYRVALLGDGGVWRKVVDLPIAEDTYDDLIPDSDLSIALGPYGDPPIGIKFLVMHPSGALIGAKGRSIYASAPLLPYAWPSKYEWVVGSDITGLVIQANDIIVLTKGHPNIITGSTPDNFAREELDLNQSCVSRDSICKLGQSVFYASPDGVVEISGASAQLVSEGVFGKDDWTALNPTTMIGETYDKKLFFFNSSGGFQFKGGVTTTFNDVIVNLFRDTEDDTLYILRNDNIYSWQSTGGRQLTWASKDFLFQHPVTWSDAQIIVESYSDCTLNFYANDVLVESYTVLNDSAFKLPMMKPEKKWKFELITSSAVIEWQIGTNGNELRH